MHKEDFLKLIAQMAKLVKIDSYYFNRNDTDAIESRLEQIKTRIEEIYGRNNH